MTITQLLDEMLASPKWEHLGKMWDEDKRKEINLVWHKLDGTSDVFRTPSPGEAEYGEKAGLTLARGYTPSRIKPS